MVKKQASKRAMQTTDEDEAVAKRRTSIYNVERMPLEKVAPYMHKVQQPSVSNSKVTNSRGDARRSAFRVERIRLPGINSRTTEKASKSKATEARRAGQAAANNDLEKDLTPEEPTMDDGSGGEEEDSTQSNEEGEDEDFTQPNDEDDEEEDEDANGQQHEEDEEPADIGANAATASPTAKKAAAKKKNKHLSFAHYIHTVHKQSNEGVQLDKQTVGVLHSILEDMMRRLAEDGGDLAKFARRPTLLSRDIEASVKLLLPGQLAKYAVIEIRKAQDGQESNLED